MSVGVSGEKSTSTTQTTIAPRSAQEQQLAQLLQAISQGAGGQLGDLSNLAGGDLSGLSATPGDKALIEQSGAASSDIAKRNIERQLEAISRQIADRASARGIEGSNIEAALEGTAGAEALNRFADVESQRQQFTSGALLNLPFQRAQLQLGANAQLFQQLVGAANPVLQLSLQERLAQGKTTGTGTKIGGNAQAKFPGLPGQGE